MRVLRRKGALLDRLMKLELCGPLSELKELSIRPTILRTLVRLGPDGYTMEHWSYILLYITSETVNIQTVEEMAAFVRQQMTQVKQDAPVSPASYTT